jgi:hypothetical protein
LKELSEAEKVESKATIGGMNHDDDDDDDAKKQFLVPAHISSSALRACFSQLLGRLVPVRCVI